MPLEASEEATCNLIIASSDVTQWLSHIVGENGGWTVYTQTIKYVQQNQRLMLFLITCSLPHFQNLHYPQCNLVTE